MWRFLRVPKPSRIRIPIRGYSGVKESQNTYPNAHSNIHSNLHQIYSSQLLSPIQLISSMKTQTKDLNDIVANHSYASLDSFREIIDTNVKRAPEIGSIIHFKHDTDYGIGMVLRPASSKFNPTYSKLLVLSTENKLIYVQAKNVVFHLHGVVDIDWITRLKVVENRHDDFFYSRLVVVDVLKHFINTTLQYEKELRQTHGGIFNILYSQYAAQQFISAISMTQIIDSLQLYYKVEEKTAESYFHQSALIMACHSIMIKSPELFMAPSLYSHFTPTNVVANNASNNILADPIYLVNSIINHEAIQKMFSEMKTQESWNQTNYLINDFMRQQSSPHARGSSELHFQFEFWDGKQFEHIINVMKLAVIYPHETVLNALSRLEIFSTSPVTATSIYNVLKQLKVYDQDSDIYLSANIIGKSSGISKISVSSENEIQAKFKPKVADSIDLFSHLRTQKSYYNDDTIYAIESQVQGQYDVGISLQQVNSRNYSINVHFLDDITKYSPKSDRFQSMMNNDWLKKLTIFGDKAIDLFVNNGFLDQYLEEESDEIKPVALLVLEEKGNKRHGNFKSTCLTVSFNYNSHEGNPFDDLSNKVSVSFDDLSMVKVKTLDKPSLNAGLNAKPKTILPFNLFKHTEETPATTKFMTNDDYFKLQFIYNVMKSHFNVRNINGAMNYSFNQQKGFEKRQFLIEELQEFVGNIIGYFCKEHDIPMLNHHQKLLNDVNIDPGSDQVLITHNNILLPEFSANSFYQTLISRDATGQVSLPAYFVGTNYLEKPELTTDISNTHTPKGILHGFVKMFGPNGDFEVILNHLQLLSYVYLQDHYRKLLRIRQKPFTNHHIIKGNGYNVNGPMTEDLLAHHITGLGNASAINNFISNNRNRFHQLKSIHLLQNDIGDASCIVTGAPESRAHDKYTIVPAFCREWGVEVEVIVETDLPIGATIAGKVVYVDCIQGVCIVEGKV